MDHTEQREPHKLFSSAARVLVISGLLSIIATTDALAQTQPAEGQRSKPRLRELIDTIPTRVTDSSPVAPPSSSTTEIEGNTAGSNPLPNDSSAATVESNEEAIALTLRLSEKRVYVSRGDTAITSYPVAIGRPGWETPAGEFEVFHQLVDPGWTNPTTGEAMPPGPDNPLGDRWIAFWSDGTNSIGFHGTPNRDSVGRAASHGCIRMYNEDVRQLYEMVSVGTPVVVMQ